MTDDRKGTAIPTARPILFSGPMVRALLAGKKTQTRRVVTGRFADPVSGFDQAFARQNCRYGAPGDTLWVRETWRSWFDSCRDRGVHRCSEHCEQTYVAYAATPRKGYRPVPDRAAITYLDESTPLDANPNLSGPWKPSIHMPRWASRLTLAVTGVRVERLQDISEADAQAEGVEPAKSHRVYPSAQAGWVYSHKVGFEQLWDEINGERAPWSSNPWVWVVEFEVQR